LWIARADWVANVWRSAITSGGNAPATRRAITSPPSTRSSRSSGTASTDQPRGALGDGVEHALEIGGRGGDDAQHFGGHRLLLQGFGDLAIALLKIGVALLQLLEEARVLDRDDGLVRERLHQRDRPRVEGADLEVADAERRSGLALTQQRYSQEGVVAVLTGMQATGWKTLVGPEILRVDGLPVEDRTAGHALALDRLDWRGHPELDVAIGRDDGPVIAVDPPEHRDGRAGEPRHTLDQGVEYLLERAGRGGDDPQHLGDGVLLLASLGKLGALACTLSDARGFALAQSGDLRLRGSVQRTELPQLGLTLLGHRRIVSHARVLTAPHGIVYLDALPRDRARIARLHEVSL
jgi:hypothetical protein